MSRRLLQDDFSVIFRKHDVLKISWETKNSYTENVFKTNMNNSIKQSSRIFDLLIQLRTFFHTFTNIFHTFPTELFLYFLSKVTLRERVNICGQFCVKALSFVDQVFYFNRVFTQKFFKRYINSLQSDVLHKYFMFSQIQANLLHFHRFASIFLLSIVICQLSCFEREAPVLREQLPHYRFFQRSPVLR